LASGGFYWVRHRDNVSRFASWCWLTMPPWLAWASADLNRQLICNSEPLESKQDALIICALHRGQLVIATVVAISDPRWSSIFAIHFETLIAQPALCNARAFIYGGMRASNPALNPHLGNFL
jgi:hypothetical protein